MLCPIAGIVDIEVRTHRYRAWCFVSEGELDLVNVDLECIENHAIVVGIRADHAALVVGVGKYGTAVEENIGGERAAHSGGTSRPCGQSRVPMDKMVGTSTISPGRFETGPGHGVGMHLVVRLCQRGRWIGYMQRRGCASNKKGGQDTERKSVAFHLVLLERLRA